MLGGITTREVYRLLERGELEATRYGRRRFVEHAVLLAYVAKLRERSQQDTTEDDTK